MGQHPGYSVGEASSLRYVTHGAHTWPLSTAAPEASMRVMVEDREQGSDRDTERAVGAVPGLAAPAARRPSLWRHADYMKLWAASTVSLMGSQVSLLAIPYIAAIVTTILVGAFVASTAFLWVLFSPVRSLQEIPKGLPADAT